MYISNVIIEVTRKCNMNCEHCLRGCAQNMDIEDSTIENLFKKVDSIGTLTVTGGEPSLVHEKINTIVKFAKKYNVNIDSFYMVTNGKEIKIEFIQAVISLYSICETKESCTLTYSDDMFHEEIEDENKNLLEALRFTVPRNDKTVNYNNVIPEGRAEDNGMGWDSTKRLKLSTFDIAMDYGINEGEFYINCKGNILSLCDLSYDTQDIKSLIIGNINNPKLNIFNAVNRFNKKIEKMDSEERFIDNIKNEMLETA